MLGKEKNLKFLLKENTPSIIFIKKMHARSNKCIGRRGQGSAFEADSIKIPRSVDRMLVSIEQMASIRNLTTRSVYRDLKIIYLFSLGIWARDARRIVFTLGIKNKSIWNRVFDERSTYDKMAAKIIS